MSDAEVSPTLKPRAFCLECRKPQVTCYCAQLAPITSTPRIVILMHPLEFRHPIGTGRMAHRCLSNSSLFVGIDFTHHEAVNALITDPKVFPMVLFPGPASTDLSLLKTAPDRQGLFAEGREPVVIVLDGTWHLAKKILHRSGNLQKLGRLCFTPRRLSRFLIRKQPHPQCFSTIEAIHEVLTLMRAAQVEPPPHDILLKIFDDMVAKQLSFRSGKVSRHSLSYLARKERRLKSKTQAKASPGL